MQQAWWNAQHVLRWRDFSRRRKALSDLQPTYTLGKIPTDAGFLMVAPAKANPVVGPALLEADTIIQSTDLEKERQRSKKPYLVQLLKQNRLQRDSAIVRLGLSPEFMVTAGRYLGCLPVLVYVDLWYSPNDIAADIDGSQNFHLDHEDYHQLKAFVYVQDVVAKSGPTMVLAAARSQSIQDSIGYRTTESEKYIPDELVPSDNVFTLTGPRGSIAFLDTSRCFHAGSRAGGIPRFLITYQYLTPAAYGKRAYGRRLPHNFTGPSSSSTERLMLGF